MLLNNALNDASQVWNVYQGVKLRRNYSFNLGIELSLTTTILETPLTIVK